MNILVNDPERVSLSLHVPLYLVVKHVHVYVIHHINIVVQSGKPSWQLIVEYFGREILLPGSEQLDRARLGKIVFGDEEKRRKLNSFTHPYIQRAILWQVLKNFLKG